MHYGGSYSWGSHMGFGWDQGLPFFPVLFGPLLILLLVWSIGIKGYALWTAARRGEKWWFIALLVINTVGLLELFYLLVIVHKKLHLSKAPVVSEKPEDK